MFLQVVVVEADGGPGPLDQLHQGLILPTKVDKK
jgi:hypothetical protein